MYKKTDNLTNRQKTYRQINKHTNRQTDSKKKRRHLKTIMKARQNIPQHLETVDLVQTCTSQKCIHILIYFTLPLDTYPLLYPWIHILYFTLGYISFTLPLDTYTVLYPWIHILHFTLGYIYFTLPLDTYIVLYP